MTCHAVITDGMRACRQHQGPFSNGAFDGLGTALLISYCFPGISGNQAQLILRPNRVQSVLLEIGNHLRTSQELRSTFRFERQDDAITCPGEAFADSKQAVHATAERAWPHAV